MNSDFLYLVEEELVKAREKHQGPIHTPHEAYGVIMEEVCEFFDEVRLQQHMKGAMLKELVQIAAMCYRAAEDLGLLEVEMTQEFVAAAIAKHMPDHVTCDHKGLRFRADDPNQQKLGMSINYKCLHGVEWTVTGACVDALRPSQFSNSCDCNMTEFERELRLKAAAKVGEL